MRVIIAGTRDLKNYLFVKYNLLVLFKFLKKKSGDITEILCGDCRGADKLGEKFAKQFKIPVKHFPADWDKYGKKAGYIRNAEMAKQADVCILFWDGKSKGTAMMKDLAEREGLEVYTFTYPSIYEKY